MYIEKHKIKDEWYLRIVENKKREKNGKISTVKSIVKGLGKLSKYDNNNPSFFNELRDSFKKGIALIPEIEPYINRVSEYEKLNNYDEKNVGYLLLDNIFEFLGLQNLNKRISKRHFKFDFMGLLKLLIFTRILYPDSKIKSFNRKDNFLFQITSSDDYHDIYKVLDILYEEKQFVIDTINKNIEKKMGRDKTITYYDVTNYYFEIDANDEDNGEKKGLRKIGVSKENRKSPIIQMGMFMDKNSIPIGYELFSGNTLDTQTLRPVMKKFIDKYKVENILIVADRGMMSGSNEIHILNNGNDYLFAKSVKKAKKEIKEWLLDDNGYVENSSRKFKYKSKIIETRTKDENGDYHTIKEKIMVYWSYDFYCKEKREKEKFIETLEKYASNPSSIPNNRKKGLGKYIITTQVDKKTGEELKTKELRTIDLEKIERENMLMGYYILTTSKLDMSEEDMLEKYKRLTKIENCFRILKNDLETRPVYVWTQNHIRGHFLLCFIALTIIRIMQKKILEKQSKKVENIWSEGISARRIAEALKEFKCIEIEKDCIFKRQANEDLVEILKSLGLEIELKIQSKKELKKKLVIR